jgi:LysM repeat protein
VGTENVNARAETPSHQAELREPQEKLAKVKNEDQPSRRTEEPIKKPVVKSVEKVEYLNGNQYIVNKGDNLFALAKKFNTSVKELKVVNRIRGNKIRVGQVLVIPNVAVAGPKAEVALKNKNHKPTIKITRSSFFTAMGGLVVHSFNLENKDDKAYKDIKLRVRYYSNIGTEIGSKELTLAGVLLPHRKNRYTKEWVLAEAGFNSTYGSDSAYSAKLELLGATRVIDLANSAR